MKRINKSIKVSFKKARKLQMMRRAKVKNYKPRLRNKQLLEKGKKVEAKEVVERAELKVRNHDHQLIKKNKLQLFKSKSSINKPKKQ